MTEAVFIDLLNTPAVRARVNDIICRYCEVGREQHWFDKKSGRGHIMLENVRCPKGKTVAGLVAALNHVDDVIAYEAETSMTVPGGDDVHVSCATAE